MHSGGTRSLSADTVAFRDATIRIALRSGKIRLMRVGCLVLALVTFLRAEPIYLGVLEPQQMVVRVAFQFRDGHWTPMPRNADSLTAREGVGTSCYSAEAKGCVFPNMGKGYPPHVDWTVAFDGRMLGTIPSSQPAVFRKRGQLGVHVLSAGTRPPRVGTRSLVVVSRPNYTDPDRWKPLRPGKAYRSSRGEELVEANGEWWFVTKGKVTKLGSNMALVDAGDYDGDGVSEVLFVDTAEGDGDGAYILFCPRNGSLIRFSIPLDDSC